MSVMDDIDASAMTMVLRQLNDIPDMQDRAITLLAALKAILQLSGATDEQAVRWIRKQYTAIEIMVAMADVDGVIAAKMPKERKQ
jgi:hypothetical protein